jgi:predicted  nucleic acid-binding Zn-ribbon protein
VLPEEKELARLEAEQAELRDEVTSAELELETTKAQTAQFQRRYYQTVGQLYARLDEIEAQLASVLAQRAPTDRVVVKNASTARQQADKSAAEAGLIEAQPKLPPAIAPSLKQAYRQAVKLMHPDLAITGNERKRRTELMAQLNLAYERGDQRAIEKLAEEFGQDPEAITGEDIGSRIVKAIRRIAQLRRRLGEVQQEMEALHEAELFRLRQKIESAEAAGGDPLGDLAKRLATEIAERNSRLHALHPQTSRL